MAFDSWQAFVDMGGYGFYVWLAYGLSALVMLAVWGHARWVQGQLKQQCEQQLQRRQRLERRQQSQESIHESTS